MGSLNYDLDQRSTEENYLDDFKRNHNGFQF